MSHDKLTNTLQILTTPQNAFLMFQEQNILKRKSKTLQKEENAFKIKN